MKSVTTYNPDSVLSVFGDWNGLIDEFFGRGIQSETRASSCGYPIVDIREEKDRYILEAELPGMSDSDVDLKISDRVITLSSVKTEEKEESLEGSWLIRERAERSFHRAFNLPRDVDSDGISATFKDGLLTVIMPKRPEAREKTISIIKA